MWTNSGRLIMNFWSISTFLVSQLLVVFAVETHVPMHKGAKESQCGKVFVLGPSHDVRLTSDGQAPDGYCGIIMYTPKNINNFTCDAICVTFKTASTSTCEIKLNFIGHMFRKAGDMQKTFDCHHNSREPFCWPVTSLRVEVIESYNYAYVWNHKPHYSFDVDVSTRCTKDKLLTAAYYSSLDEAKIKRNYVEGLVVGLSLASVFLVILLIMYCYYKHKATESVPADDPPSNKKGAKPKSNIFTTFRAKLPIIGRNRNAEHEEPEQTAIYRKTASTASTMEPVAKATSEDPEILTELSPLTGDISDEKQTAFDEVKLVISNQTEDDLKKFKEENKKLNEKATSNPEEEEKCETPDVVVHSDTTKSVVKSDEKVSESVNA